MTLFQKIIHFFTSKRFLINLGLIVLLYVIAFFVLRSCLHSSTRHDNQVEVPNLIGKNQSQLAGILEPLELKYVVLDSIYAPSKPEGTILAQTPKDTKTTEIFVKSGRSIRVRVSKKSMLVEMPNLVDKSQRFAEAVLRNRKFKFKLKYIPTQEAHGAVLKQLYKNKSIETGVKIPIGSTITLEVGKDQGVIPQNLPDLTGLTIEEAQKRVASMMNMDFIVSIPDGAVYSSADSAQARVVSQSPEYREGAQIAGGSSIQVLVSKEEQP